MITIYIYLYIYIIFYRIWIYTHALKFRETCTLKNTHLYIENYSRKTVPRFEIYISIIILSYGRHFKLKQIEKYGRSLGSI